MNTQTFHKLLNLAEPISSVPRMFTPESYLTPRQNDNSKHKETVKVPNTHSTPPGDASSRPPFFSEVYHNLFSVRREAGLFEHLIVIAYRGFCIGALGSAIVAAIVAQPSITPTHKSGAVSVTPAKACYQFSANDKERCV